MFKRMVILISLLFCGFAVYAQETTPLSLDLKEAIQRTLQNNPRAILLQKQKAIADAEVNVQSQRNNPSLIAENTRSQPNYFVGAGYVFELGGKRGKRITIAREEAAVAAAEYQAGIFALRREVRQGFYELLQSQQKRKEMDLSRDLAKRLLEISQQRFEVGEVARFEVLQAGLELKRRENEWKQVEAEGSTALLRFNALLNRPPGEPLELQGSMEDQPLLADLETLLERAISVHPDLQTLQRKIQAEEARLSLAHAQRIPDLDVEGGTEIHDADFQYGWRAALRLDVPLLNRNSGEILKSNITLESLRAEQTATQQKVRAEISSAYIQYQAALFQAKNYHEEILPAVDEIEQMSEESYREGKTGFLSVLDAQRNMREIRLEYLDLLMRYQTAVADLELTANVGLE